MHICKTNVAVAAELRSPASRDSSHRDIFFEQMCIVLMICVYFHDHNVPSAVNSNKKQSNGALGRRVPLSGPGPGRAGLLGLA